MTGSTQTVPASGAMRCTTTAAATIPLPVPEYSLFTPARSGNTRCANSVWSLRVSSHHCWQPESGALDRSVGAAFGHCGRLVRGRGFRRGGGTAVAPRGHASKARIF